MVSLICLAGAVLGARHDVVMIAVDDMRPELGSYGCDYMKTPHIDALARESVVFDRMYVGIALCGPSRSIFLTSRRPDTARVWSISDSEYWRVSGGNFTSLPQYFRERNYITYGTGKIFHPQGMSNHSDQQYSWSPGCLNCNNHTSGSGCDRNYREAYLEPDGENIYVSPAVHPYVLKEFNCTDDDMGEGKLAANAVELLEDIKQKRDGGDTRPFFFAAGFHRPHIPWHAPQHYYNLYDLNSTDLAPHQHLPFNVPMIALNGIWTGTHPWGYMADIAAVNVSKNFPNDNTTAPEWEQRKIRRAYRAAISFTDRNIGVVVAALKRLDFFESSIVVFWSDHGYQLGDNDQYAKHTNFEHATRIPFMIKLPLVGFPDFKPGRRNAFVESIDLMPTLAELGAGAPLERCPVDANSSRAVQECTEGLSFAPLVTTSSVPEWKTASFSQYARREEKVMGYTIRTKGYRYTEWVEFNTTHAGYPGGAQWDKPVGAELYAHPHDPKGSEEPVACDWDYEFHNLAKDKVHADLRAELSKQLRAGWRNALPPV